MIRGQRILNGAECTQVTFWTPDKNKRAITEKRFSN